MTDVPVTEWPACGALTALDGVPGPGSPCVLPERHNCPHSAVLPDADLNPVCDLCGMPAAFLGGRWQHAEVADAGFCSVLRTITTGPVR